MRRLPDADVVCRCFSYRGAGGFSRAEAVSLVGGRHGGRAFAERKLHHHGVEPAAEFEADIRMGPDHLKPAFRVHADRPGIGEIADHRDHLPVTARLAFPEQALQQL